MIDGQVNYRKIVITAGVLIFLGAAILGWIKLQYGFNFIDEGYHMTSSWRLTAGDQFLKDKVSGAEMLYNLINASIFKIYPKITLLGFRQLQYCLTILALFLIGGDYTGGRSNSGLYRLFFPFSHLQGSTPRA